MIDDKQGNVSENDMKIVDRDGKEIPEEKCTEKTICEECNKINPWNTRMVNNACTNYRKYHFEIIDQRK